MLGVLAELGLLILRGLAREEVLRLEDALRRAGNGGIQHRLGRVRKAWLIGPRLAALRIEGLWAANGWEDGTLALARSRHTHVRGGRGGRLLGA